MELSLSPAGTAVAKTLPTAERRDTVNKRAGKVFISNFSPRFEVGLSDVYKSIVKLLQGRPTLRSPLGALS